MLLNATSVTAQLQSKSYGLCVCNFHEIDRSKIKYLNKKKIGNCISYLSITIREVLELLKK